MIDRCGTLRAIFAFALTDEWSEHVQLARAIALRLRSVWRKLLSGRRSAVLLIPVAPTLSPGFFRRLDSWSSSSIDIELAPKASEAAKGGQTQHEISWDDQVKGGHERGTVIYDFCGGTALPERSELGRLAGFCRASHNRES